MRVHPIHYSLLLNLAVLALTGFLAYVFKEPMLVVVALLLTNHSLARFSDDRRDEEDDDDEDGEPSMGFLSRVK